MASDLCATGAATVENSEQEELEEKKLKNKLLPRDYAWAFFHMLIGLIEISFIWQQFISFSFRDLMSLPGGMISIVRVLFSSQKRLLFQGSQFCFIF